jgi:hypothetical protein
VKESQTRINPRHRDVDLVRLAAAILDLSVVLDDNADEELQIGADILTQLRGRKEKSA